LRSPVIPPMLAVLVQGALVIPDRMVFDHCESCPVCGGSVSGYDTIVRQFARILDENGIKTITVTVKRFRCRSCGAIVHADEPFYPGTRIGSPIVDLCIAFSQAYGYGRGARNLRAIGSPLSRMQCRHYAALPVRPFPIIPLYGFPIPQSILALSTLSVSVTKGSGIVGAEALAACGFPSAGRAALHLPGPGEKRDDGNKEEGHKKRDAGEPEHGREQ